MYLPDNWTDYMMRGGMNGYDMNRIIKLKSKKDGDDFIMLY